MTTIYAERRAADEVVGGKQRYSVRNVLRLTDPVQQVQPGQATGIVDAVFGMQGGYR